MAFKSKEMAQTETTSSELVISDDTKALFASMVTQLPDADTSGMDNILQQILNATTWDELDDPWDTEKAIDLVDKEIRIDEIMRRPSDFADGLGIYLVIKGAEVDSDKKMAFTSGSISIVAQLVKAYMLGAYPLYAILRRRERATTRGYHPFHLEIIGSGAAPVEE